jgi:uncharacterized protein (TIGR02444 family)
MDVGGLALDNRFWRFSTALYAAPGVEQECLALQDAANVDVNLLLFCAWLAVARRVLLSDRDIATMNAHVERWRETAVRPLRAARRGIKALPQAVLGEVEQLRKRIAAIELEAEQIEQAMLFEQFRELGQPDHAEAVRTILEANLRACLRHAGGGRTADPRQPAVLSLIEAALAIAADR